MTVITVIRRVSASLLLALPAQAFELPAPGPVSPVTTGCIQAAAQRYRVEPLLILAILKTEGGRPGLARRNTNGTYDLGPMQVNTLWVKRAGLNAQELRDHGCYNVFVGTAILANELVHTPHDMGAGIGNYHSRTPKHHARYRRLVQQNLKRLRLMATSP